MAEGGYITTEPKYPPISICIPHSLGRTEKPPICGLDLLFWALGLLEEGREKLGQFGVAQVGPVTVEDAVALVEVSRTFADVVGAHDAPDGPLAVVGDEVFAEAVEVLLVLVREAIVGSARHAEAELGEDQGRSVFAALLEHKAVIEPVLVLGEAAVGAAVREIHREAVRVPLPHVLPRPVRPVHWP